MKDLFSLFAAANISKGVITIPPGDYDLTGVPPIQLTSNTTVKAYGARFHLPENLGDQLHRVFFRGENLHHFQWLGGHFIGHVFDPAKENQSWPPHANTRAILITTTPSGQTADLTFRDISSEGLAGAVITVCGAENPANERLIDNYARGITVQDCTLERSGKFMWDYGSLWQITVWPEDYTAKEHSLAQRYFRHDLVHGPVRMESGDDRVWLKNVPTLPLTPKLAGVEADRGHDAICFFGDTLPVNVVRGRQYAVVESSPEYIRIAEEPGGAPITFQGSAGNEVKLIANLFEAHLVLFAPIGSGPGKGALDLVGCENIHVRNCQLSALGDTMHIQKSRGIHFTENRITGSRMGAFFLAEFCQDARIVGNDVDGTNGSRVMSVEKSCENILVSGNTFRNGGRGSWINQPRNFVLTDNVFINNTTKCDPDPHCGRRSFLTGDYERYAELYFTTYELGGRYGEITIKGNTFKTGPNATHAISFENGGGSIEISGNTFAGSVRTIDIGAECTDVKLVDNQGL